MLYRVGQDEAIKNLLTWPRLYPGDIVELMPGVYTKFSELPVAGIPESPVIIRAVVPHAAILNGESFDFGFTPRSPLQIKAGAYTIQGLTILNVGNGGSSASGLRCITGQMIAEDVYIRNCAMGVHGTAPTLVELRRCDIGWCGFGNQSHNIYISGSANQGKTLIEDSIIQGTAGGINVKIRSKTAIIRRSKIYDSIDGEIQFCDGPETLTAGSDALVEDCEIRTLADRGRGNMARVIAFGNEGKVGTDRVGTLTLRNNQILLRNKNQVYVSLDSTKASLISDRNFLLGVSNNLLRVRYPDSVGTIQAPLNYMNGLAFRDWPSVYTPPAPPPLPDTTPPEPPTNLRAEQGPARIILMWDPSVSPDVAYYEVSEQYGPYSVGKECRLVHQPSANYPGRTYTYTITAVDNDGNRSKPTAPFSVIKT